MRKKTQYIVVNEIYKTIYCGYPQKRAWKIITGSSGGIEKTKKELGYEPRFTWRDYLLKLKWHMENQPNAEIWGRFEDYYDLLTSIKSDKDRFEK